MRVNNRRKDRVHAADVVFPNRDRLPRYIACDCAVTFARRGADRHAGCGHVLCEHALRACGVFHLLRRGFAECCRLFRGVARACCHDRNRREIRLHRHNAIPADHDGMLWRQRFVVDDYVWLLRLCGGSRRDIALLFTGGKRKH
ncbi:hypothetical protein SDC9_149035 [bioreactor metagenome]|uniref:Uncharacterized protein n=1 Tax=bioreactor metagenome TaxID=1076179 RepID=A0A645EMR8_9ZZZZ